MLKLTLDPDHGVQIGPACEIRFRPREDRLPLPDERIEVDISKGFRRMVDVLTVAPNGYIYGKICRVVR